MFQSCVLGYDRLGKLWLGDAEGDVFRDVNNVFEKEMLSELGNRVIHAQFNPEAVEWLRKIAQKGMFDDSTGPKHLFRDFDIHRWSDVIELSFGSIISSPPTGSRLKRKAALLNSNEAENENRQEQPPFDSAERTECAEASDPNVRPILRCLGKM